MANEFAKLLYNFDEHKEYKKYKEEALSAACYNYNEWEDYVTEKYKNNNLRFLRNFRICLNKKIIGTEQLISYIQQAISFLTLSISIFLTLIPLSVTIKLSNNYIFIFFVILITLVIIVFIFIFIIQCLNKRIDFLNDYIKIIDETISEKQNSSSTEDKV